jgi:hypothetical protein
VSRLISAWAIRPASAGEDPPPLSAGLVSRDSWEKAGAHKQHARAAQQSNRFIIGNL